MYYPPAGLPHYQGNDGAVAVQGCNHVAHGDKTDAGHQHSRSRLHAHEFLIAPTDANGTIGRLGVFEV